MRSVAINYEDALWVAGMAMLRDAYLTIVPELEPYLVARRHPPAKHRGG